MPKTHLAVLFDMDGLMLDTERMVHAAFELALGALGQELPEGLFGSLIGRPSGDSHRLLEHAFGPEFPLAEFRRLTRAHYERDLEVNGIGLKPGIEALLEHLHEAAIPFGCATSTARERAWWKLERAGISHWFDTLVGGDEVARGKPAPDIFIEAAGRLAVQAEHCIVLEDSPTGVRAGAGAGMTVIMVPDLAAPDAQAAQLAYAVVQDLYEARALVGELLRRPGR